MDLIALLLMFTATVLFVATVRTNWALACTSAALICQFVALSGHVIVAR